MLTKKNLVSALIAVGALGAVAAPLPSSAADFGFSFSTTTPVRYDSNYYGRDRHYQSSRWDRDGDGIPNRYDRTPDGRRWGGQAVRMRDSDRDGVPDRYDNYPYNPRWR